MTRFIVPLNTLADRRLAQRAIERAPAGYVADIHESKRSDEQNRALWSLLNQIVRQRPTHNGVRMDAELYKAVFLNALGVELRMVPNLDGNGFFPLGYRSSQLTKSQFADLLELILAWAAREGLTINHFDDGQGRGSANNASSEAA